MISKTTSSSLFSSFFIVLGLMSSEFLHLLLFSDFWFLKSSLFSESLRKVVQRLKVFFFFSVALPARPFWKDTNMNLNVHFVCICYVCMNRYLSRRQFSYAPMDVLPFVLSLPPLSFSLFQPLLLSPPSRRLFVCKQRRGTNVRIYLSNISSSTFYSYLSIFVPLMTSYTLNGFPVLSVFFSLL